MGTCQGHRFGLGIVKGFVFGRWEHPKLSVQAPVIEPVDIVQGGVLDVIEPLPGAMMTDQFGLVEPSEGLGEGIVLAVAPGTDRRDGTGLGQTLGILDGQVLRAPVTVMDQPSEGHGAASPERHLQGIQGQVGP